MTRRTLAAALSAPALRATVRGGAALLAVLAALLMLVLPAWAGATVLWKADAESALSNAWAAGNAFDVLSGQGTFTTNAAWSTTTRVTRVTSPVAQGTMAYAMTVVSSDHDFYTTNAQRTEVGQGNPSRTMPTGGDRQFRQGDDMWVAWQLQVPASYPIPTSWVTFTQFKGAGTGNGPFGIYFDGNKLSLGKSQDQTYGNVNIASVWSSPTTTVRDQWIKLLLHVKWSTGSDGSYELWGDLKDGLGFRRLKALTSGWTLKFDPSNLSPVIVHARIGIYRAAVATTSTVYYDGFNASTTRGDATLTAFGESL
jgi:polysaccharide lyase-like protein